MAPARRRVDTIGWREWVALPDLGVGAIKAKVDTGARTSSLHAFGLRHYEMAGEPWVRFEVHPEQRSRRGTTVVEARIVGRRKVRSSSGHVQERPVIKTRVTLNERTWPIEVTLTDRDEMGFRMLLGRAALRRKFVIDPGHSFLAAHPRTEGTPADGGDGQA